MGQRDTLLFGLAFMIAGRVVIAHALEDALPINVAVTFSVLGGLVKRVAGDSAEVLEASLHELHWCMG